MYLFHLLLMCVYVCTVPIKSLGSLADFCIELHYKPLHEIIYWNVLTYTLECTKISHDVLNTLDGFDQLLPF